MIQRNEESKEGREGGRERGGEGEREEEREEEKKEGRNNLQYYCVLHKELTLPESSLFTMLRMVLRIP